MHAQWSVADGDRVVSDYIDGDESDNDDEAACSEEEEDPRSWLFHVYPTDTVKVFCVGFLADRISSRTYT